MIYSSRILVLAAACFLSACGRSADVHWKDGDYKVYATDVDFSATRLGFSFSPGVLGLVDEEVVAVGSDSKFIVAKRDVLADGLEEFYLIKKIEDASQPGVVEGPFSKQEFGEIKKQFALPDFSWIK